MNLKACKKCERMLPIEESFYWDRRWNRWGSDCKECRAAYARRNRGRATKRARTARRRRHLGLTEAGYQALVASQGNVCALCGRPESRRHGTLATDHDHETGEIRGLLCASCNTALGRLGDSAAGIRRVLAYLEEPPARRVLDAGAGHRVQPKARQLPFDFEAESRRIAKAARLQELVRNGRARSGT